MSGAEKALQDKDSGLPGVRRDYESGEAQIHGGSGTDLQFSGQGQDNSDCGKETGTDNRDSAVPRRHCAGYAVS